ncbi:hypothetical protein ACH4F6_38115 [Streptomyces sp. NPDC017936]|uniref:hypothetical protein n=1 Tax=Streptomyces sp. NPDC017936 TaxID=3365016 RepID=UPI0037B4BBED
MVGQESTGAETTAAEALMAVVGDSPHDARRVIQAASFRDRALIVAWAEELSRLARQGQTDYESREREEWRDRDI